MCEGNPNVWESLAEEEWHNSKSAPKEVRDSTTGEVVDPD